MKPIDIDPRADAELHNAVLEYRFISESLGTRFRVEFERAVGRILAHPKMYGVVAARTRACPIHGFPFTMYYRDFPDRIRIAAVTHNSRKPYQWKKQKP